MRSSSTASVAMWCGVAGIRVETARRTAPATSSTVTAEVRAVPAARSTRSRSRACRWASTTPESRARTSRNRTAENAAITPAWLESPCETSSSSTPGAISEASASSAIRPRVMWVG